MQILRFFILMVISIFSFYSCTRAQTNADTQGLLRLGAERMEAYLPLLEKKKVGLFVNNSSKVGQTHILDALMLKKVNVVKIFAPEHGFRGDADAGAYLADAFDPATGLPIISLYGSKKKPSPQDLSGVDIFVFDLQDVGVRFYTYISSLHYAMEACAEQGIPILVLDRPNPNGHYIDGPILDMKYSSFVGMHPVPIVHGMTIGEYARMIVGEKWINKAEQLELNVIPCENYRKDRMYELPHKPSPNLPNLRSILLYPSLCFFEGTDISVGRGTEAPFQQIGHPSLEGAFAHYFQVESLPGASKPPHMGKRCFGLDYSDLSTDELYARDRIDLQPLFKMYTAMNLGEAFFLKNGFFDKLAGSDELRKQIMSQQDEESIRKSWEPGLEAYKVMKRKYEMY